jgi:hypothetical protein
MGASDGLQRQRIITADPDADVLSVSDELAVSNENATRSLWLRMMTKLVASTRLSLRARSASGWATARVKTRCAP